MTTISFMHENDGNISIELLDKEGKVIKALINEYLEKQEVTVEINASDLSSSEIYFIRVTDNGKVSTKKFFIAE